MKLTIDNIIREWIKSRSVGGILRFPSHTIQIALPTYGQLTHGILHTPDSYSRAWRRIREQGVFNNEFEIEEEDGSGVGKKEKYYIVKWRVGQLSEISANKHI